MERKYRVNPTKFFSIMAFSIIVLVLSLIMLWRGRLLSGLIFMAIAVGFGIAGLLSGMMITVDGEGVKRSLFGKTLLTQRWEEIAEVGIAGTKLFHSVDAKKTGELYIYFSTKEMSEDEHFQMMLKWPPKNMSYLLYDKDRLEAIHLLWGGKITTYNTGKLRY